MNLSYSAEICFDISKLDDLRREKRALGYTWIRTLDFANYYLLVFSRKKDI